MNKDQAHQLRSMIGTLQEENRSTYPLVQKTNKRVLVVASGKGGVGKTTVSLNLSLALIQLGYKVVLFDADIGLANVDVMLGVNTVYNLSHVLRGERSVSQIIHREKELMLIAGGSGVADLLNLKNHDISRLVESIADLESLADILIIDTGAGISSQVVSFIAAADELMVVCTPEPTSLTDAYALIKKLSLVHFNRTLNCVVNRVKTEADARHAFARLSLTSNKFLGMHMNFFGFIREDESVAQAIRSQQPLFFHSPHSMATNDIKALARRLVKQHLPNSRNSSSPVGFKTFFGKLVRLLS